MKQLELEFNDSVLKACLEFDRQIERTHDGLYLPTDNKMSFKGDFTIDTWVNPEEWTHVVLARSTESTFSLYIDGQLYTKNIWTRFKRWLIRKL